jgi:DNA-binding MarR family transcriptional regulator
MVKANRASTATKTLEEPAGPTQKAWALMQQFVDSHNRHGDLAQALGFRLGAGRGKVLFQLRQGAMTLSDIAETNGVDAPYATLIVDKLEAHGLVTRQPHPDDRVSHPHACGS